MYNDSFKDKIKNTSRQYVYGVQNNGDIFVSNFVNVDGSSCKDYFLGNYNKRDELPKNSYNWDMKNIPSVNEFHIWISEQMEKLEDFANIKDEFEYDLGGVDSKEDFKKLLETTLNKLK